MGLQSWANNGVVVTDVLKDLGIQIDSSSVKFEHLEKVLQHLTSEGQMFGGIMEKQMNNLSASWGQLMDDWDTKLNELGIKYQDAMKKGIEFGSFMISHYDEIVGALTVLIGTYGAYRAALWTTILLQKALRFKEGINQIKDMRKQLGLLTAAQRAFNLSAAANPYILIATAITGACLAIWQLIKAEHAKKQAVEDAVKPLRDEFTQTNLLVKKNSKMPTSKKRKE
ncbi:MAG: hypothetical protein LIP01_11750 [Tannerellaceae bacterium]|nr:hypothetical protein [Tannerellaceae bacterium]